MLIESLAGDSARFESGQASGGTESKQRADFWYLTGIDAPGWQLVIDGHTADACLIAPKVDETERIFNGSLSFDEAAAISGIAAIYENQAGKEAKQKLGKLSDHSKTLSKQRAIKQPVELAILESSARLTIDALDSVRKKLPTYRHECEIEADITHHFRWHNAVHAFEPIVGYGGNACTLHYSKNSAPIAPGGLVLIDVGAKVGQYGADITRTLAIGEPSKRHQAVHAAVQLAQRRILELISPGVSLKEYIRGADFVMKEALMSLGLMNNLKDDTGFRRYFPHAMSHGLGVEVHESLGGYETFMPGMVLTVEPGIYIPEEGIGVRIEDDVLVTDEGHRNLTAALSTDS